MKAAFDISILDSLIKAPKTPADANKHGGEYKPTTTPQNVPQPPQNALQGKRELLQGIRSGADPYPLLLEAVKIISSLTGDKSFYTITRDIMQGMGQLESLPPEWERDSAKTSLQRLEATRRNIDAAITAHKQWLDGQPISEDENTEDEYNRRIKKCFGAAYKFIDEHKHARTSEDWTQIVDNLSSYTDPLAVDLIVAAVSELEREYKEATNE